MNTSSSIAYKANIHFTFDAASTTSTLIQYVSRRVVHCKAVFSPPFAVNGTIMRRWKCRFKQLKTKDGVFFIFCIQSVIYAVILNIKNY